MKRLFLLCTLLCLGVSLQAKDYLAPSKALLNQKLEHPYLMLNATTKEAIKEQIKTDPNAAQVWDMLLQQGRRVMLNTVEPERPVNDVASRYKETSYYEQYVGFYMGGAQLLAFLYQMTGDEAYAQKAWRYADKLCALENWAAGAHHFEIIYPRVWPSGAKDDQVLFSYDIMTGDCALAMGLVYDWIYPVMTREQRDRMRGGILENAITRVRGNYEYHWWSEAYKCNWSAICHGGLGVAALALLTEDPHLVDVVARSYEGMEKMLANYGPDNGWAEGRHYGVYGIRESLVFADAMKTLTGGTVNLFSAEGLRYPADFSLFGEKGSFNDGFSPGPTGYSYMYNKLAAESRDPNTMYYLERYFNGERRSMNMWELIWPRPTDIPAVKPEVASKHFTSIDWAFMRKDFGDDDVQVALKCAPMDDPHHGHLDAGTFDINWKGDLLIGEVEQKFYDQFFFNETRWEYLYVRSLGHNVIHVNDEEQITCKHKNEPWIDGLGGRIEKFYTSPEYDYTMMDPTNAYPKQELKGWKRAVILDKENGIVLSLDRVACARGAKIDVMFHPRVEASVNADRTVSLTGKNASMEMQPLVNSDYEVTLQKQYTVRVVKNSPVQVVPCIYTTLRAPGAETIVGTAFYPAELKGAASSFSLDQSGRNPVIRYTVGGKAYAWEFGAGQITRL